MNITLPPPLKRQKKIDKPFSPIYFLITVTATFGAFCFLLRFLLPKIWATQLSAHWYEIFFVFLAAHLVATFAEFFFHRYILHAYPIRFLKRFFDRHSFHHALTSVRLNGKEEVGSVSSHYPIVEEKQHEASYFPWFSLTLFLTLASPLIGLIQWLLPREPVMLGSIMAITWSLVLYEFIHAVEHLPYDKFWKSKIEHRHFGKIWGVIYSFHLRHHANVKCNEAVGGFFGIPIPDLVFRTYAPSQFVLVNGAPACKQDFVTPTPCRLIVLIDRLAQKRMKSNSAAT